MPNKMIIVVVLETHGITSTKLYRNSILFSYFEGKISDGR